MQTMFALPALCGDEAGMSQIKRQQSLAYLHGFASKPAQEFAYSAAERVAAQVTEQQQCWPAA